MEGTWHYIRAILHVFFAWIWRLPLWTPSCRTYSLAVMEKQASGNHQTDHQAEGSIRTSCTSPSENHVLERKRSRSRATRLRRALSLTKDNATPVDWKVLALVFVPMVSHSLYAQWFLKTWSIVKYNVLGGFKNRNQHIFYRANSMLNDLEPYHCG